MSDQLQWKWTTFPGAEGGAAPDHKTGAVESGSAIVALKMSLLSDRSVPLFSGNSGLSVLLEFGSSSWGALHSNPYSVSSATGLIR